ncbi:MAG: hypothetical protein Fur0025_11620 [Oscillatoriaceae cyanobacterium]
MAIDIYEAVPMPISLIDVRGELFLFAGCNRAAEAFWGIKALDGEGKTLEELLEPEAALIWRQHCQDCLQNGFSSLEQCHIIDGEEQWWRTVLQPLPIQPRKISRIIATSNNITAEYRLRRELETAKQEAQQAQTELHQFFDLSSDMLTIATPDNYLERVNPAATKILGYSTAELESMSFIELIHPDDRQPTQDAVAAHFANDEPTVNFENRYRTKDGGEKWLAWSAAPSHTDGKYYCVGRDVTEIKKTQAALRQSEAQFRALFEYAAVGMGYVSLEGRFLRVNQCWCDFLGLTPEEMQSLSFPDITHPDDLEKDWDCMRHLLAGEVDKYTVEKRYIRKDGEIVWVKLTASLVRSVISGEPEYFIAVVDDITPRKELEKELALRQARFDAFFHNSNVGMAIYDDQLRYMQINDALAEMNGIPAADHLGKTLEEVIPDLAPVVTPIYLEVMASGQSLVNQELSGFTPKQPGFLRHWIVSYFPLMGESGCIGLGVVVVEITARKLAEEALRESEQRYQTLARLSPVGIFQSDAQGNNTYSSERWCEITGFTQAEAMGQGWLKSLHPDDLEMIFNAWQQAIMNKTPFQCENRLLDRYGNSLWVLTQAIPELDDNGEVVGYVGTITDINDRKRAEQEAQRLLETLKEAQRIAHIGNWEFDAQTLTLTWSEEMFRIMGMEPETTPPSYEEHLQIVHPDDRLFYQRTLERAFTRGTSYDIDLRLLRPDGSVRWVNAKGEAIRNTAGKVVRLVGTAMDITERERTQQALRQSEAQLRSLFTRAQLLNRLAAQIRQSLDLDAILQTAVTAIRNLLQIDLCVFTWYRPHAIPPSWEVYAESKRPDLPSIIGVYPIGEVNPLAQRVLNRELIRVDDAQTEPDPELRQCLLSLGYAAQLGLPFETNSGAIGTLSCIHFASARPWRDEEVELLTAVQDQLTIAINQAELYQQSRTAAERATAKSEELEQTLRQLQRTQTQLIQAEKMSSLGQMVAGVAHEINNPVSFIYGNITHATEYVEQLLDLIDLYNQHYPQPAPDIQAAIEDLDLEFMREDFLKILDSMKSGANRISTIVKSLRTFSRLDEADIKEVDIHECLESTLLLLDNRIQSQNQPIHLIKEYGTVPLYECYPSQLNQVFMNTINNAIDALESIKNDQTSREKIIRITTEVIDGQKIAIHIADNGPGISPDVISRLFDPFFTTKPVGKGTGLGLSISYQIVVERHGGDLRCISAPGEGTEFIIELPLSRPLT